MKTARQKALEILYSVEFEGAYSNLAIKSELQNSGLDMRDRGLVTQLVYGTVSKRIALDAIIQKYSSVKIKKLSKYVLLILRLGLYQIFYCDKIPVSAAVNESVKLAKKYAGRSAGFINGVLRSAERGGYKFKSVAEELSYPDFLWDMWSCDFGAEKAKCIMEALNKTPFMTVRVNTLKCSLCKLKEILEKDGVLVEEDPLYENSLRVKGLDVLSSDVYNQGLFTVQDTAAQCAAWVLSPKPKDKVLDLCAAPGGKTTHMAELMNNEGSILAFDIHEHKTKLIDSAASRLGIDIIKTECSDATKLREDLIGKFDCVLADVPCSGLGIIRRKPEIKYNASPGDDLYKIQEKILDRAAKYLKPGGILVYSTCTLNKFENELRIKEFLENNPEFCMVSIADKIKSATSKEGYCVFYPDEFDTDGFFVAKLCKRK